MRKSFFAAAAALLLGAVTATAAPATAATSRESAAARQTATVSILHAVPGLTVDVYAGDKELVSDFEPGTLTDPLKLPAGTYDLKVFKAGQGPDGEPAISKDGVKVPGGANATVVAHLGENGDPMLTPFVNDTSKVAAGKARLTVRHVAAAPAVDVRANGKPVVEGLTNPNEAKLETAAGPVEADVVLAGTDNVVIGPANLDLGEGTNTIVYAWGSAEDGNLKLATQVIEGLHTAPGGVPGGTGGQAEPSSGPFGVSWWLLALIGAGFLAAATSGVRLLVVRGRR
ncbi:hypothetical protein BJF79_23665 [Actinomadura sp. CNU-125]|uniref:DUF4397 domain-containing protein n=1 Tax=Actinomadura sp. CNU-125 TaxID=1904961 RepID=UPI0009681AB7|nr:DUF4397 domain-containing protein [Actinomadura sp. CNU-125]OLT11722.1 hypothetical protein BJF79_23665 [Actinomadura sp. CNU-125]